MRHQVHPPRIKVHVCPGGITVGSPPVAKLRGAFVYLAPLNRLTLCHPFE
jgi:hypothetical protein